MSEKPNVRDVVRLDQDAYNQLVSSLPNPWVTETTSVLEAGQKLGIQLVLQKLREGFVVGR